MKKLAIMTALCFASPAFADSDDSIRAKLIGYEEVPSVSTVAKGKFEGKISSNHDFIDYKLTYSGLQGTVTQAHIHFAQRSVNGGIVIWLCQTPPGFVDPTNLSPICPQSGVVTGHITAANVVATAAPPAGGQQISAGELAEVIAAIRAGNAYANVHTNLSPGGEIRGQIRASDDD